MVDFGLLLRSLRLDNGLSQMQLSRLISIPQATIARFELGKTEPRLSDLRVFCRFFGVSADYLLGLTDC